jgi:hypothetical protein
MNNDIKSKTIFLKCACYGHAIEVEYDEESDQYNISIWKYGIESDKLSFKERIRWAWRLFTRGNLWADEIILTAKSKEELVKFLSENKSNEKTILHG